MTHTHTHTHTHQLVQHVEGHLPVVGLRHQQLLNVDAQLLWMERGRAAGDVGT